MKASDTVHTTFFSYKIIEQIGEGGSGYVSKVERIEDGIFFALKILKEENIASDKFKRFKNEYGFMSSHMCPYLMQTIDAGKTTDEKYFYIMPFATKTLRTVIKENNLSGAERNDIALKLLEGVLFLHKNGVTHRDLKPENILFVKDDIPLIADLGIAHFEYDNLVGDSITKTDDRLANFQYAAPEQRINGSTYHQRIDIYALGLIINELFTGKYSLGLGRKKVADLFPEYGYWDNILDRMMQSDTNKRFNTIKDIKGKLYLDKYDIHFLINDRRSQAAHFHYDRFNKAFPDTDVKKIFTDKKQILGRLKMLLRYPLILGSWNCVYWTHGINHNYVKYFKIDELNGIAYINDYECNITKIIPVESCCDYKSFVYIEVSPLESLRHTETEVNAIILTHTYSSQVTEDIGYYDGRLLSSMEMGNGIFYNENGDCIKIDPMKLFRFERFLAPWNFLLLSQQNSLVQTGKSDEIASILDDILMGRKTIAQLQEYVDSLSKPDFYN